MTDAPPPAHELLERIAALVQAGKTDAQTNIPPGSQGQPGVIECVEQALAAGLAPQSILDAGLLKGVQIIGRRFAANEVFIPEVLIAARAMQAGLARLRPHFAGRDLPARGVFVVGTVQGDLHDIGKNLVGMVLAGAGWNIVDLGVDCPAERFLRAVEAHPGCALGLSALLTTTMLNMRAIVTAVRARSPETAILVGGAPVTADFAHSIGASGYAADPASAVELLDRLVLAA
jgi:methanogenic corrinoid protein MtbC1